MNADVSLRPGRTISVVSQKVDDVRRRNARISNGEAHVSLWTVTRSSERTPHAMCD